MRKLPKRSIPFIVAGLLIGLFLTLQLKSDVSPTTSYPLDEYEFQVNLVQSFVDDQAELEARLNELQLQVGEAEESVSQLFSSTHTDYLQELKKTLGLTEVSGQGIEIIMDDSERIDRNDIVVDPNTLVRAADLRDLVNLLRTFPHEGISINGQRIVATTAISSAGSSILINNFHLAPPFEIRMVTDVPVLVLQKLSTEEELPSIYDRVTSSGVQFKFKETNELTLPAYIGGYSTQHMQ